MILPLLNLLIKYTRCSVTTGGSKITLAWKLRQNYLKFVLPKREAMLVSVRGDKLLYLRKFTHGKMTV